MPDWSEPSLVSDRVNHAGSVRVHHVSVTIAVERKRLRPDATGYHPRRDYAGLFAPMTVSWQEFQSDAIKRPLRLLSGSGGCFGLLLLTGFAGIFGFAVAFAASLMLTGDGLRSLGTGALLAIISSAIASAAAFEAFRGRLPPHSAPPLLRSSRATTALPGCLANGLVAFAFGWSHTKDAWQAAGFALAVCMAYVVMFLLAISFAASEIHATAEAYADARWSARDQDDGEGEWTDDYDEENGDANKDPPKPS